MHVDSGCAYAGRSSRKKIMIKNKNVIALVSSSRRFSIKVDLNMEQEAPSKIWKEKKKTVKQYQLPSQGKYAQERGLP